MMKDVRVNLNVGLPCECCVQQEGKTAYLQIGLKFNQETSKMLNLEHGNILR